MKDIKTILGTAAFSLSILAASAGMAATSGSAEVTPGHGQDAIAEAGCGSGSCGGGSCSGGGDDEGDDEGGDDGGDDGAKKPEGEGNRG